MRPGESMFSWSLKKNFLYNTRAEAYQILNVLNKVSTVYFKLRNVE